MHTGSAKLEAIVLVFYFFNKQRKDQKQSFFFFFDDGERRRTQDLKATKDLVLVLLLDADLVSSRGNLRFAGERMKEVEDTSENGLKTCASILHGH